MRLGEHGDDADGRSRSDGQAGDETGGGKAPLAPGARKISA